MNEVRFEQQGAVAILRFSNPPHGYMDGETETALAAHLDRIEGDDSIRAVVLTGGQEDVFIRHYDVSALYETAKGMAARGMSFSTDRPVPEAPYLVCLRRMEEMAKPFIAAINGTAMGGGFEMALACDIRLVKDGPYDLGLPEINLGILPGAGGTQRLTRLLGEAKALEMILLGRTISPREAAACGIASACIRGDVLAKAMELANGLARRPPRAMAHIKGLIKGVAHYPPDEGLARERTLFCDLMVDEEALQEMKAMSEGKRDILDPLFTASRKEEDGI